MQTNDNEIKQLRYHSRFCGNTRLGYMKLRLTNDQFEWMREGATYSDDNLELLRRYYVDGMELKELSEEAGFSSRARIYNLVRRFEAFVEKKLKEKDCEMSVVIHRNGDESFLSFDICSDKDG